MNKHLCKSWQITVNFIAHWSVSKLSALNHENKTDRDRFAVQNSTEENHKFLHLELQSYWLIYCFDEIQKLRNTNAAAFSEYVCKWNFWKCWTLAYRKTVIQSSQLPNPMSSRKDDSILLLRFFVVFHNFCSRAEFTTIESVHD